MAAPAGRTIAPASSERSAWACTSTPGTSRTGSQRASAHRLREPVLVGQDGADQHDAAAERPLERRRGRRSRSSRAPAAAGRSRSRCRARTGSGRARRGKPSTRASSPTNVGTGLLVDAEPLVEATHATVLVDGKQREADAAGGGAQRRRDLANASVVARRDAGNDRNVPARSEQRADHRHVAARRERIVRAIRQHDVEADRTRLRGSDAGQARSPAGEAAAIAAPRANRAKARRCRRSRCCRRRGNRRMRCEQRELEVQQREVEVAQRGDGSERGSDER